MSTRRRSRQAVATEGEADPIELIHDAPADTAPPTTPASTTRKRAREAAAATHDSASPPAPASPPPSAAPTAAPTGRGGRGRKPAASKAADALATERDDAIKQHLLDHPHTPLSLAHAATVYQLHVPPCAPLIPAAPGSQPPKACKLAGHPNCLHTLGYRRKGMWAAHPPHVALLGSDPGASLRPIGEWYAGLKNQSATCYINILVQSLYMNTHFRDSLMRFESAREDVRQQWEQAVTSRTSHIPTVDASTSLAATSASSASSLGDHLPYHLLTIFARLALSRRSFIDPVAFVRALGVLDAEQQDAHEFRTYMLQSLEHALRTSTYKPHHTLLQTLFEGSSTSILRCQLCGHESTTASPFIDLTLPIKGRDSVYASMHSLCDVEQLEENAVYCSTCKAKTSMDKRLEYDRLPPYLSVQLMRFELVFAGNGVRKKKIGEKIYIPEKIRMEGCLLKPKAAKVDARAAGVGQEQQAQVTELQKAKVEEVSEAEEVSAVGRKRSRRRGAVKDEAREELECDMTPIKQQQQAKAVKEEERIVDETAMEDVEAGQAATKQSKATTERRRSKVAEQATANGTGEDKSAAVGRRGKGRGGRGGRGRGRGRGSNAPVDLTGTEPSDAAIHQPHAEQNGHGHAAAAAAAVESLSPQLELVGNDDVELGGEESERAIRTRLRDRRRGRAQPASAHRHWTAPYDEDVVTHSRKRPRKREVAKQETEQASEINMVANVQQHPHTTTSHPSTPSDAAPAAPSSPQFPLTGDEDPPSPQFPLTGDEDDAAPVDPPSPQFPLTGDDDDATPFDPPSPQFLLTGDDDDATPVEPASPQFPLYGDDDDTSPSPQSSPCDDDGGGAVQVVAAIAPATTAADVTDQQSAGAAASASSAAAEMSDENETLGTRLARSKKAQTPKRRRRGPIIGDPNKRHKARAAAKSGAAKPVEHEDVVEVEDDETAPAQQNGDSDKPATKRRRKSTTSKAAAANSKESNNSSSAKTPTKSTSKSKRVKPSSSSSPGPNQPSATPTVPSVYSPDDHPSDYHLAAVLLHKGQYANHGHYTATLRDDSGCWWSFDDRVVSRLGERFYNRGGEVVVDGNEGKQQEDQAKRAEEGDAKKGEAKDEGESSVAVEKKHPAVDEQDTDVEVVVMEAAEDNQPSSRRRGGRRRAKQSEEVQAEVIAEATDSLPAKRRSGRPKKAAAVPAEGAEAAEDKPVKDSKKRGKPKKAAAQKVNADASGVDAKTKKEAERMYGPGGYSKDAYMLLYCNKRHEALATLKKEQELADAELHSTDRPPTFLNVASHPHMAEMLVKKYHADEIDSENASYHAECAAYSEKRSVIETEMERRKAEVEEVAAILQAQAIEVDKAADEQLDAPLEERAEVLEQGKRSRFVSTQWLSRFLTGWTAPEKEKKAEAKAKKSTDKKEEQADGRSDAEADKIEGGAALSTSPVIDISSDDDSSADNSATDKPQQRKDDEPTVDEPAEAEKAKMDTPKDEKDEKDDDPGAIVIDHDVHISADGMEQAMRTAISHLDPGPLSEAIDSIRCPHHRDKLNPHVLTTVKRVTVEGWERLVQFDTERSRKLLQESAKRLEPMSLEGDVDMIPSSQADEVVTEAPAVPSMALSDVCLDCARRLFLGDLTRKRAVERVRALLESYRQYRSEHKNDTTPPGSSVWLSNVFVQRWKKHCQQVIASAKAAKDAAQQEELATKQKQLDSVELGDAMEGVRCEHGVLGTDNTARVWVSRTLWDGITAMASVEAELISVRADECPQCKEEEEHDNEEAKQHKAAMKDERAALRLWVTKSHRFPDPSSPALLFTKSPTIYLLPQSFHTNVASYLQRRDPASPPRPRYSPAPLLCEPHGLLRYVPRPEGEGGLPGGGGGTPLGVLVYCDEKVWGELKWYGYVAEDDEGVRVQHTRIVPRAGGEKLLDEQWSSYELTSTPAVCEECVRQRQAAEEVGRTVFTKEDGGGIRVTTVTTEEEAKSTSSASSSVAASAFATSASSTSPASALPLSIRPRRAAATRGTKQPLAILELHCSSSTPVYQLKMELLAHSYTATAAEPARQHWYYHGRLMDDARPLSDYGVIRGGEVKVWLAGDGAGDVGEGGGWEGGDVGRMEMWVEGKKGGKGAAAERGFQGTALAMHARQHVQNAAVILPASMQNSATDVAAAAEAAAPAAHDQANGQFVAKAEGEIV